MNLDSQTPIKIAIQELIDSLDDANFKVLSSGIGLEEDRRVKKVVVKDIRSNVLNSNISNNDNEYNHKTYSKTSKNIVSSLDKEANVYRVSGARKDNEKKSFFNKILFKKESSILNTEVLDPNFLEYNDYFYENESEKENNKDINNKNNDDSSLEKKSKKLFTIKKPFNYLSSINYENEEDQKDLEQINTEEEYDSVEDSEISNISNDSNENLSSIETRVSNDIVEDNRRRWGNLNRNLKARTSKKVKPNIFIRFLAHGIDICVILVSLFISSILISKVLFPNMKHIISDNPLLKFMLNMNILEFVVLVYVLFIIYKFVFKTIIGTTVGKFCFGIKSK